MQTMEREELLKAMKEIVYAHDPTAQVILFGSQARGDASEESDWDLLILTNDRYTWREWQKIERALIELEWRAGQVIIPIFRRTQEWNAPMHKVMAFHKNVERDGVLL